MARSSPPENSWFSDTAIATFEQNSYWIANSRDDSLIFPCAVGEPNGLIDDRIHILRYLGEPSSWKDGGCEEWTWAWSCESS